MDSKDFDYILASKVNEIIEILNDEPDTTKLDKR